MVRRRGYWALIPALVTLAAAGPARAQGTAACLPAFTEARLSNGLRVYMASRREQPAVSLRLLVPAGSRDEPVGREGLALLCAALLRQGTREYSATGFTDALDRAGARMTSVVDAEYTVVGLDTLSQGLPAALHLFAQAVAEPSFAASELRMVREQQYANLRQRGVDPLAVAGDALWERLFGADHRLGRHTSAWGLFRTGVDDVRAFHALRYEPAGSVLVAVGDVDPPGLLARLEAELGCWHGRPAPPREPVEQAPLERLPYRFEAMRGLQQGAVVLGTWGLPARHPDDAALRILNYVLGGGGLSSRLMTLVRSDEGRTYGISSQVVTRSDHGCLVIATTTRNEEVAATVQSILKVLDALRTGGVTPRELEDAKSYFSGNLALRLETPGDTAGYVLSRLQQGYTLAEVAGEAARLQAVTAEDVQRVAQELLDPGRFAMVVVGDRAALRPQLKRLGPREDACLGLSLPGFLR